VTVDGAPRLDGVPAHLMGPLRVLVGRQQMRIRGAMLALMSSGAWWPLLSRQEQKCDVGLAIVFLSFPVGRIEIED